MANSLNFLAAKQQTDSGFEHGLAFDFDEAKHINSEWTCKQQALRHRQASELVEEKSGSGPAGRKAQCLRDVVHVALHIGHAHQVNANEYTQIIVPKNNMNCTWLAVVLVHGALTPLAVWSKPRQNALRLAESLCVPKFPMVPIKDFTML